METSLRYQFNVVESIFTENLLDRKFPKKLLRVTESMSRRCLCDISIM